MLERPKSICNLTSIGTSHNSGEKFVFYKSSDCVSNITQVAHGRLLKDEIIEFHNHPTMEEFFYVLNGRVEFSLQDEVFNIGSFEILRVPPNIKHRLLAIENSEFFYWGVSVD